MEIAILLNFLIIYLQAFTWPRKIGAKNSLFGRGLGKLLDAESQHPG
jgi:hypothetical protein